MKILGVKLHLPSADDMIEKILICAGIFVTYYYLREHIGAATEFLDPVVMGGVIGRIVDLLGVRCFGQSLRHSLVYFLVFIPALVLAMLIGKLLNF